jgi:hypothetical protein
MKLLVALILIGGTFALLWWLAVQSASQPTTDRRPARRRNVAIYEDDTGYESPLGLVDDPDDEWMEWAIIDDMLDGDDGDGWW